MTAPVANVDEYIRLFPEDVQVSLQEIRRRIGTRACAVPREQSYCEVPACGSDSFDLIERLVHLLVTQKTAGTPDF